MNSRIFPTQQSDKLDKSAVVKTIGIEQLSQEMNKLAGIKKEMTKTASANQSPVARQKKRYSMKPSLCASCGVEHPCSCDIIEAKNAGDTERVAQMMEQRENRRMAYVQQFEQNTQEEARNERTAFRSQLFEELQKIAQAEKEEEDTESCNIAAGSCEKCGDGECKCKPCKKCGEGECKCDDAKKNNFAAINKLSATEKDYFAKYAEAMGWPVKYVEAVTASSVKVASIPEATKLVLSNKKLAKDNKKQLIIAMHKAAKLAPEQANRIRTYWSQELGYPDTEWIGDLVQEPDGK